MKHALAGVRIRQIDLLVNGSSGRNSIVSALVSLAVVPVQIPKEVSVVLKYGSLLQEQLSMTLAQNFGIREDSCT